MAGKKKGPVEIPYNPYLALCALSKLEFPISNIYCIIPKERTPQPLQLSFIIISISYGNKYSFFL